MKSVVNAGVSTNIEIGFSVASNKPIYAYEEQDDEICRQVLFRKIAKTPDELLGYLK